MGLLIWTAYGVCSSQNMAIQNFAAHVLQEDLALADYGAEASPGRARIRDGLRRTIDQIWGSHGDADFVSRNYHAAIDNMKTGQAYLDSLHPSTESQKQALAAANQAHASRAVIWSSADRIRFLICSQTGRWSSNRFSCP
jgi:hypothetical protein